MPSTSVLPLVAFLRPAETGHFTRDSLLSLFGKSLSDEGLFAATCSGNTPRVEDLMEIHISVCSKSIPELSDRESE
jgi:hypothetical protein